MPPEGVSSDHMGYLREPWVAPAVLDLGSKAVDLGSCS